MHIKIVKQARNSSYLKQFPGIPSNQALSPGGGDHDGGDDVHPAAGHTADHTAGYTAAPPYAFYDDVPTYSHQ